MPTAEIPRRWAWPALGAILIGSLALRLWGVRQGLPYAYNTDEADHFLPRAVAMFQQHSLNPHYFANPPAFTYVLHGLLAVAYGSARGAVHAFEHHPADVYTLARVATAVLGVGALWLLYATGARLFGRVLGLLAAAIEAVAFLPVFYAHLALNDVPTLAPATLSLLGSAGVLRKGRARDYLLAGVGLGLACASKYTAGIMLLPLIAAAVCRFEREPGAVRRALVGVALAAAAAVLAFLIANPYALLDYQAFHSELVHQSTLAGEAQGKLGAPRQGGLVYYLWSLTWGLGWVPALAALGGAVTVWRSQARLGWLLVPAPVLFLAFMGLQGRYFGRWLLPIVPILCLLAACFALQLTGGIVERLAPAWREQRARSMSIALIALAGVLLCAQGLIYSVHSDLVLSREDTRSLTRAWMLAHIPPGSPIVVEPVSPAQWGSPWRKYYSLVSVISADGALQPSAHRVVGIEEYERTLAPALIGYYEKGRYCWVVRGSTQSGRAFADAKAVPLALAYYRALEKQGEVVYSASPYTGSGHPVAFGFDWSFDYYPLSYERPGPTMTIYRLHGGRCAG
jgi:4-amino-4-deoxy-L-arabinose transferase-like glycosyltransferase